MPQAFSNIFGHGAAPTRSGPLRFMNAAPRLPLASSWQLMDHPPFSVWLMLVVFLAAGGLIVYLYRAQRAVAPRRAVNALTAIRIALLLLLFILLLAPVVQWKHTHTSAGTLWLMIDHSKSMGLKDPQASAVGRLRWACALGYLPGSLAQQTAEKAATAVAEAGIVQQRIGRLHQAMRDEIGRGATRLTRRRIAGFTKSLIKMSLLLRRATRTLDASAPVRQQGAAGLAALKRARSMLDRGVARAQTRGRMRDATHAIAWLGVRTNLMQAVALLKPVTRQMDQTFLNAHQHDSVVQDALARVAHMTRAQLAYAVLVRKAGSDSMIRVIRKSTTKIAAFGAHVRATAHVYSGSAKTQIKAAFAPVGDATNMEAGLQYIAGQIAPREPASVLIVSDGRQNAGGDPTQTARLLAARGIPIFTLCVGSHHSAPDAAVEQIHAPNWIYRGDHFRATALIRLDGLKGKRVTVQFYRGKKLLATRHVFAAKSRTLRRVTFRSKPVGVGVFGYSVRVVPLPEETDKQNNQRHFRVAVKKEKLQVLLVDNQPDWEFQYLQNYLARDKRIHLQSVLLHPAVVQGVRPPKRVRASSHNPVFLAQKLPDTNKGWSQFDVIILGDVAPEDLPTTQQEYLANAVRNRGSALVCIAGRHNMPFRYADSPLAELLPVELSSHWSPALLAQQDRFGFRPTLAPEGTHSVLGKFGITPDKNAQLWSHVPLWYWHSEQTDAKPSARVLWEIANRRGKVGLGSGTMAEARRNALLATMSVGLGKVLYLAADQTWRLRYVAGDNIMNRFWGQVLRWAVGNDLPAGGKFVRFGVGRSHYVQGQPVTVRARVLGRNFTPLTHLHFQAVASAPPQPGHLPVMVGSVTLKGERSAPGYYSGTLTGLPSGVLTIGLRGHPVTGLLDGDPTATEKTLRIHIVRQKNMEMRNTDTDPAALARIAYAGNGIALNAYQAQLLAKFIPKTKRVLVSRQEAGFFASPRNPATTKVHVFFLLLFTALIAAEWIIRKRVGLI